MKKSVKHCIGYTGQIPTNLDFRKFEKSAPSKIENLVEISVFFNETVIRPTSKRPSPHLRYWFFKAHRLVLVSDLFKWFQSDFFKNRLKLELFWVLLFFFIMTQKNLLILWYGGAASSFVPICSVFIIFVRPDSFRIYF